MTALAPNLSSSPPSVELSSHTLPAGSPWFGVSSPMDQDETAEWQQVERFLDMLVASKSTGSSRNVEQLASAFARHLTVIRQREELRIHSIRQLQTDCQKDQDHEAELSKLRAELDDQMNKQVGISKDNIANIADLQSELKASEQQAEKVILEERKKTEKAILEKEALTHAMDMEFAKFQREREELSFRLLQTENEQAAVHRLSSSERERDAARLELLEAELNLARNKVIDLEKQVNACKQELKVSEKGRKEALNAANAAREECMKVQKEVQNVQERSKKLEKERKVYETAARKAAGELVNLRLRSPSPDNLSTSMRHVVKDNLSTSMRHVVELAENFENTMGSSLDISVGAQSGSDKATTASDSKESYKVMSGSDSESPNSDKPFLARCASAPISDSDSNQNSSPENTCKGETVMRAALELAAAARWKAEKALSMREEERNKDADKARAFRQISHESMQNRVVDALADSIPRVSPLTSPRFRHPQPQATVTSQTPACLTPTFPAPTAPQRHPSPAPARESATRPFSQTLSGSPMSAMAGATGTRSMTNLQQARTPSNPTHSPHDSRAPGPVRRPPGTTVSSSAAATRSQVPQRVSTAPQPLTRRR